MSSSKHSLWWAGAILIIALLFDWPETYRTVAILSAALLVLDEYL